MWLLAQSVWCISWVNAAVSTHRSSMQKKKEWDLTPCSAIQLAGGLNYPLPCTLISTGSGKDVLQTWNIQRIHFFWCLFIVLILDEDAVCYWMYVDAGFRIQGSSSESLQRKSWGYIRYRYVNVRPLSLSLLLTSPPAFAHFTTAAKIGQRAWWQMKKSSDTTIRSSALRDPERTLALSCGNNLQPYLKATNKLCFMWHQLERTRQIY